MSATSWRPVLVDYRSTRREPPTRDKQLVSFITCGCEPNVPFYVIYKAVALSTIKSNQMYFVLYLFNTLASSTDSGNDVLTVSGNVKARMPASIPTAPNIINGNA
jgi:hypothetical protein